jgi:hypothetical protein
MHIDPALLSALSALVGALMGGTASLVGAIYTQRYQDRLQRVAREATKREQVYADFIMSASKLLLNAYVHDGITLTGDEQRRAPKPNEALCSAKRYQRGRGRDQRAHRDLAEAKRGVSETRNGEVIQEPATRSASTIQPGLPGGFG